MNNLKTRKVGMERPNALKAWWWWLNDVIFDKPRVMPGTATNVTGSYTCQNNNKFHTDRNILKLQPTFSTENTVRTDKKKTVAFNSGDFEGNTAFPIREDVFVELSSNCEIQR
jgi:hypothetical protein